MAIDCGNCGFSNPDGSRFCMECGAQFEEVEEFECPNDSCTGSVHYPQTECPLCGQPLEWD